MESLYASDLINFLPHTVNTNTILVAMMQNIITHTTARIKERNVPGDEVKQIKS